MIKRRAGSILVEAVVGLWLFFVALILPVEWFRRVAKELVLEHCLFLYTRERALGEGAAAGRRAASAFLAQSGEKMQRTFWREVRVEESISARDLVVVFHARYPSLLRFSVGNYTKHHFEIHRRCRFTF